MLSTPEVPPVRCGTCGKAAELGASYCSRCGVALDTDAPRADPTAEAVQHSLLSDHRLWYLAAGLFALAAVLAVSAHLPNYYGNGDFRLADSGPTRWYNAPSILVWLLTSCLLIVRPARPIGVGLGVAATGTWWAAFVSDVGAAVFGDSGIGLGFVLGTASIVTGLAAVVVVLLMARRADWFSRPSTGSAVLALVLFGVALVFAVGTAMPWQRDTGRITKTDQVWTATGTKVESRECCTLLQGTGWDLAGNILELGSLALVPVVLAALGRKQLATGAALGAGLIAASDPLSSFAGLRESKPWLTPDQVKEVGAIFTFRATTGLWIAVAAVVSWLFVALASALLPRRPEASASTRVESGHAVVP